MLALDIGGTKLAAGVVDATGAVLSFVVAPSEPERGPEDGLERLFELGRRAIADAATGISSVGDRLRRPARHRTRRAARAAPSAPLARRAGRASSWKRAFDRPAALENDATAAAAGEHRFGAGAGTTHMVYLTVSTGVGGGVVADGRLYRGAMGNGGELGHVTVDCNGRLCRGCGRHGCLEAYASGTSIAERAVEALAERRRALDSRSARAADSGRRRGRRARGRPARDDRSGTRRWRRSRAG